MPGDVSISFARDPSYFGATPVEGHHAKVIVGRTKENRIVGMGTRAEKRGYMNGRLSCFGYVSGLRLQPQYRSLSLLGRGFQFFKKLHFQGNIKLYLATITEDNIRAQKVLTSQRAGLSFCRGYGCLHTVALRTTRPRRIKKHGAFTVRPANADDMPALLNFLNDQGKNRQFFPQYEGADFKDGLLKGLKLSDIFLAFAGRNIIGSLGFWDQRPYKQNIVHAYSPRLKRFLWAYNAYASLSGKPLLPKERSVLKIRTGAICCIKDDDEQVFRSLLQYGLAQPRYQDMHSFVVGFHEQDPLLKVVTTRPHHLYKSRLYIIFWEDGQDAYNALDRRIPYIEIGGL